MTALKEQFNQAVEQIKEAPTTQSVTQEIQLKMYALFKQANEGDIKGSKPSMLNPVARAKYKAWAALQGMNADDAMKTYVGEAESLLGS